ncbi:MAG TPA: ABC transporter ATP-binding protein [Patescibacteria group bacterium]|nr:ABC transporter ATP-binding protein [Patescibacteria group bacterium]
MSDILLEVKNLVKNYGNYRAVDGISFQVERGKAVGFLGPNGAGKTTTIQILCGITLPNGGTISYFGKDFAKHKEFCLQKINFGSAFNTLLGRITAYENLLVYANLYGIKNAKKKIDELLEYFEITHIARELYQNLSAGQKTRVNLVKSLLNDPEILLMDEPTASLDPDIADKTLSLIEELRKTRNLSLLFTSHNMEEVTRICDEVIFLDKGKIVAQDTPLGLTKRIQRAHLRLMFDDGEKKVAEYLQKNNYSFSFEEKHTVGIETIEKNIPKIIFGLSQEGIWITDIEVKKPNLEDVFLQIARGEAYETT